MLHLLLLLGGLQLPEKVQSVGGLRLVAVDGQGHREGQHHGDDDILSSDVVLGAIPVCTSNYSSTGHKM